MKRYFLSRTHFAAALAAGLALRLFFAIHFPFHAGDTKFYEELARNWLYHGVYGVFAGGTLAPADMRMPGYPAFLAAIHAIFGAVLGRGRMAVALVQIAIDLGTCVIAAMIAAQLAPAASRRRVATIALWMAALCPFTANYAGVVLTETLATCLTTVAILLFVWLLAQAAMELPSALFDRRGLFSFAGWFLLGGCVAGVGTLVRPETPLLLAAAGLVLAVRWRRRANWAKLVLAGLCMALGLVTTLLPWAARNSRTLGRIEFLSPRYAQSAGDYMPRGFYAWTGTWMTRFGEAYRVTWKIGKAPIQMDAFPNRAFDSQAERARVAALVRAYDGSLEMSPALDRQFGLLARERSDRHPLRTYLEIPAARAAAIWFTPRVELLPYSGRLWPLGRRWHDNAADFSVTAGFGALALLYVALALMGAQWCRRHPGFAFIAVYFAIRTAFLTQMQTVEPRYVLECVPSLLAIGALCWCGHPNEAGSASESKEIEQLTYRDHLSTSY